MTEEIAIQIRDILDVMQPRVMRMIFRGHYSKGDQREAEAFLKVLNRLVEKTDRKSKGETPAKVK